MSEQKNDPAPDITAAAQPDAAAGQTSADDITDLPLSAERMAALQQERIAELEAEAQELRDRWLRAQAEMQNLRARTQKEVAAPRAYATQNFAEDVVEAAENLRRGLASLPAATEDESELMAKLRGGFEGVEKSFLSILERNGVTRVEALGQPFDPELHQAMAEQPAPEGVEPGTVIQAWTSAWLLRGRLIKPAMVIVAK